MARLTVKQKVRIIADILEALESSENLTFIHWETVSELANLTDNQLSQIDQLCKERAVCRQ